MSFFDDLSDIASGIGSVIGGIGSFLGSGIGGQIAKTAVTGYALYKTQQSINKDNQKADTTNTTAPDPGVRLQVNPDPEHKIPIVYGQAALGGIVTDAVLTNGNKTMWYCMTISEFTGYKLSDGLLSAFTFYQILWNDQRLQFQSDGITVASMTDRDGNVDTSLAGLVKIYCYSGGSGSLEQKAPGGYTLAAQVSAMSIMPGWGAYHQMNSLNFALVKVDYNKEKHVTQLPKIKFDMINSMVLPGDVLYDYMTNTQYGAGIAAQEIYSA